MSELVTVETVEAVESLRIPGIGAEAMRKIGSAQRIAEQERTRLDKQLGIPASVVKWSLNQHLPPEVLAEIKKKEPNLSVPWRRLLWLRNEQIGLLLIDGSPAPLSNVFLSELPEWTHVGMVSLAVHNPKNPRYRSVVWKMDPRCSRGQEYGLPSLSCTQISHTTGQFPLSVDKIHVFDDHSFTLVKTYEPWQQELSRQGE